MRIIIAGSRTLTDYAFFERETSRMLANIKSEILVISGMAKGPDTFAIRWAKERGLPVRLFPADWATDGPSAGFKRNARMIEVGCPDALLAFWDGQSHGTAHMIGLAREKGLKVRIVRFGEPDDADLKSAAKALFSMKRDGELPCRELSSGGCRFRLLDQNPTTGSIYAKAVSKGGWRIAWLLAVPGSYTGHAAWITPSGELGVGLKSQLTQLITGQMGLDL
jgi:hypothetical protein